MEGKLTEEEIQVLLKAISKTAEEVIEEKIETIKLNLKRSQTITSTLTCSLCGKTIVSLGEFDIDDLYSKGWFGGSGHFVRCPEHSIFSNCD